MTLFSISMLNLHPFSLRQCNFAGELINNKYIYDYGSRRA